LEVAIDKQGRIVIPKEVMEKYGLSEELLHFGYVYLRTLLIGSSKVKDV